jgi:D-alanyl-D-alanine carboxypeptidase/D-alanyl-D-alanine-endopeptidase (penicillin-binding protein 4)
MAQAAVAEVRRRGLTGDAAVAAAMEILLRAPEVRGARVSLVIEPLEKGTPTASSGASLPLNPASNSKLATSTLALGVLGPEFRFETAVSKDDEGNLFVKGGLDPTLTTADLKEIALTLKEKGIQRIEGDVFIDNSRLVGDRNPAHFSEFGDEDWDYLARPEPFSVDKNLLSFTVRPGKEVGAPAVIEASGAAFEVRGDVTTVGPGVEFKVGCDEQDRESVIVRNKSGQAIIDVKGTIASDFAKGKALVMKSPDVVASSSDRLAAVLREAGIVLAGRVVEGETPKTATSVHVHRSAPLADILRTSIATSNAFDHEMVALAASAHLSPDGRTTVGDAMKRMNAYLVEQVGLQDCRMDNASGLGDANRLSARDMVALLRRAHERPANHAVLEGLACPGKTGTLKTRMLDTDAEGRLHAKTGTLRNVVALSGVVERSGLPPCAFSVLVNDYRQGRAGARAFLDAVGVTLASLLPP